MIRIFCEILGNTIILDHNYTIRIVSKSILKLLGCSEAQLIERKISGLCSEQNLEINLKINLRKGFFKAYNASLSATDNRNIAVSISGFFLNLLSDHGDYIVLTITNLETPLMLREKTEKLEHFLYRASHDLRGPIATIKGLINIANMRADDKEVDLILEMISLNTGKLDEQLTQLINAAQDD